MGVAAANPGGTCCFFITAYRPPIPTSSPLKLMTILRSTQGREGQPLHSTEGETEAQEERPVVQSHMVWQVDRGVGKGALLCTTTTWWTCKWACPSRAVGQLLSSLEKIFISESLQWERRKRSALNHSLSKSKVSLSLDLTRDSHEHPEAHRGPATTVPPWERPPRPSVATRWRTCTADCYAAGEDAGRPQALT